MPEKTEHLMNAYSLRLAGMAAARQQKSGCTRADDHRRRQASVDAGGALGLEG